MKYGMKLGMMASAVLAMALCASAVRADDAAPAPAPAAKVKPIAGEITKIEGASVTVQPKAKKNADAPPVVVVTTNDSTTVTINGDKKAVTDLAVGQKVSVTVGDDGKTATAITEGKMPRKNAK